MASGSDVDHSLSMLPSARKGSSEACSTSTHVPECPICLQTCVHPVQLPCRHVFCFLCVKGASWQSKRCALCRQEVPDGFLERPTLLLPEELKSRSQGGGQAENAWYYEGRNGWWQYDERTSLQLEDAFAKGKKSTEMLIAGLLYVADLENMVQYRRNEHSRRRKMKRDAVDIPKKGVAGLRLDSESLQHSTTYGATGLCGVSDAPDLTLGGLLENQSSPSLESSFAQLQISTPGGLEQVRSAEGEGVGDDHATPSSQAFFPHAASANTSRSDSSCEGDEDYDGGHVGQAQVRQTLTETLNPVQRHMRHNQEDRTYPGGESVSNTTSSRRVDGHFTVTEV